ncbi:MAG TPA: MarR family transcriptional regulator [Blastocatellia bacterium]|nr:MarR family transcriptional regulator [Blastocatellia bacterium]
MSSATKEEVVEADKRERYYKDRVGYNSTRYPEHHRPSVELILNFLYTYDVFETEFARWLATKGLSMSGFNVLMILDGADSKGRQLHELGELLLVSRANVTGLIDCLEQRGLVERALDKTDRRVRIARITKLGESLLESMLAEHYKGIRRLCAGMTGPEKVTLNALLTKLRYSIRRSDCWNCPNDGGPGAKGRKSR